MTRASILLLAFIAVGCGPAPIAVTPDAADDDAGALFDAAVCTDRDGDGYYADCVPLDCDDDDSSIFPGAPETCDGVDQDCTGAPDEGCACELGATRACGLSAGACEAGEQRCEDGAWGDCAGGIAPADEACDGSVDDDCDAVVDEGCACTDGASRSCGSDVGACVAGTESCASGAWGACTGATEPAAEVCDGSVDDDCDSVVDEGCACTDGASRSCGSDVGACIVGTQSCASGAWGSCAGATTPSAEVCDGSVDDDCDGDVDEGCPPTRAVTTVESRRPILAIDSLGRPHIAYVWSGPIGGGLSTFGIGYAYWDGSGWEIDETTLPQSASNDPTFGFSLDAAERPVVVIVEGTAPHHVIAHTRGPGGWTAQTITTRRGVGTPNVLLDGSGRLSVFVPTYDPAVTGATTEVSHFREDGAGGWAMLTPMFQHVGDYSWGPGSVSLGTDGLFHGVTARRSTATTPGGYVAELRYARPWTDGTNWTQEVAASNAVSTAEGYNLVARDLAGVVHVTSSRSGRYHRRTTSWPVAGTFDLVEAGHNARAGVEIEPASAGGGGVLVYGDVSTDLYVVRRLAPDGTATTIATTPSVGVAPLGDAVSHDLVLEGTRAHLVYTATECGNAGCTVRNRRIHYAVFDL